MKEILVTTAVGTIVLLFAAIPLQGASKKTMAYAGGFFAIFAGYGLGELLQYLAGLV